MVLMYLQLMFMMSVAFVSFLEEGTADVRDAGPFLQLLMLTPSALSFGSARRGVQLMIMMLVPFCRGRTADAHDARLFCSWFWKPVQGV